MVATSKLLLCKISKSKQSINDL